ncbi:hypothetical protein [Nocardia sp. SSK8]
MVLLLVSSTLSILRGIALIAGDQLVRVPGYARKTTGAHHGPSLP